MKLCLAGLLFERIFNSGDEAYSLAKTCPPTPFAIPCPTTALAFIL